MRKPRIWHLSGDFPDPVQPDKTTVIQSLIDLTAAEFDHTVISVNRQSPGSVRLAMSAVKRAGVPRLALREEAFPYGRSIIYRAPARGLWHASMLRQLGNHLAALIQQAEHKPDLIVAHKLTIEGIAVLQAAAATGLPYAVTLQGTTDRKILAVRPDLLRLFRQIYRNADVVFAFAPNTQVAVEQALGLQARNRRLLPCPTDLDRAIAPARHGDGLISVFHLKNHRLKNLSGLSQAAQLLATRGHNQPVAIYGGGTDRDFDACQRACRHSHAIEFRGPLDRSALRERLNAGTAFVLPSRSESFGLVFVEALFCGLPIIYPADRAIDGYLDGAPFALRVDPASPQDIANAMQHAVDNEVEMKAALAKWQTSGEAYRFTRPAIAEEFAKGLNAALG